MWVCRDTVPTLFWYLLVNSLMAVGPSLSFFVANWNFVSIRIVCRMEEPCLNCGRGTFIERHATWESWALNTDCWILSSQSTANWTMNPSGFTKTPNFRWKELSNMRESESEWENGLIKTGRCPATQLCLGSCTHAVFPLKTHFESRNFPPSADWWGAVVVGPPCLSCSPS